MAKVGLVLAVLSAIVAGLVWQSLAQKNITHHLNPAYENAGYPFSESVAAGGWLYISGTLGTAPGTAKLVTGGIGPETAQTMDNIKAILARQGLGMDRIVKCTVMLAAMSEWPAFNAVYATYFEGAYPARSAFGTSGLALGARVEIECIAKQ